MSNQPQARPHDHAMFVDALVHVALGTGRLAPDQVRAARACLTCRETLRSLELSLAPSPVEVPEAAGPAPASGGGEPSQPSPAVELATVERGAALSRWMFRLGLLLNVLISSVIVIGWLRISLTQGQRFGDPTLVAVRIGLVVVLALLTLALVVFGWPTAAGRRRLYARWQHRWLQGICAGLGAYFGVSRWVVRAAFVTLFVSGWYGGTLYVVLAFIVPFHPDDRIHLTGFRIRRWWRQRRARTGEPEVGT